MPETILVTDDRHIYKCINKACRAYHRIILAMEPRAIRQATGQPLFCIACHQYMRWFGNNLAVKENQ